MGGYRNSLARKGVRVCTDTLTVRKERCMVLQEVTQHSLDLGSEIQNFPFKDDSDVKY